MAKNTFEKDMTRLEEIVKALEKGEAPLEESLSLFTEGTALVKRLGITLDTAERKIRELSANEEGPELTLFNSQPEES